jgi:2-oxoisovalerate dehydrogenase E2 component (dihydrolipoyl transacylase)
MGVHEIKLPDVGEGVAEAELVEWMVKPGDHVREDQPLAAVMTDKATVEIPAPVAGKVQWLGAKVGDILAVGSPIVRLDVDGKGNVADGAPPPSAPPQKTEEKPAPAIVEKPAPKEIAPKPAPRPAAAALAPARQRAEGEAPLASPAVRKRALDNGVDLRRVAGSGPAGRITHEDLDGYFANSPTAGGGKGRTKRTGVTEKPVIGLRRKIAEKMTISRSRIPDIVYVDEVDMSALEDLRGKLNAAHKDRAKLTLLPFLMSAMSKALADQPHINSTFDDEAGVVTQSAGVHIGIATQTDNGLVVPVVRHAEALSLWDAAAEITRLAEAARKGQASREELSGSTITITSLGALGGLVTTPVINHPEVAIIGVNKMQVRPMWDGQQFIPRKMMNLSCAFDHRIVDGWDAAVFVQRIKTLLENPAMIFIED